MSQLTKLVKAEVLRIIYAQFLVVLGVVILVLLWKGMHKGLSLAAGAFAYGLPTLLFMLRVSAQTGAQALARFMMVFLAGEVMKLLLCGVLFLIAVAYLHLDLLYAMMGLISAIVAFWIASVLVLFQVKVRL